MKSLKEFINENVNREGTYKMYGVLPKRDWNSLRKDISDFEKYITDDYPLPDPSSRHFIVSIPFSDESIRPELEKICKKYSDSHKNNPEYSIEIVDIDAK